MLAVFIQNYTRLFNNLTRLLLMIIVAYTIAMLLLVPSISFAVDSLKKPSKPIVKDYGTHGHLFKIDEQSLLKEIMAKLLATKADGTLEQLQSKFVKRAKEKILRPNPVANIGKAQTNRSWTYDPTYRQHTNITDAKGRIIVAAGTTVNALEKMQWGIPLIFIDGDDKEQIEWVKDKKGKIILTNGAPLELAEILERPVYFDQGGIFCRKFNIHAVPAIIKQDALLLRISEIAI